MARKQELTFPGMGTHDCVLQFHYWGLLGCLHPLSAHQCATDEGRCGEAKRVVWIGASNSAGVQLFSPCELASAATDEFIADAARGWGAGGRCFRLPLGITRDALGALDSGRQLEQLRDLQAGTRANPDWAVSVGAASDL